MTLIAELRAISPDLYVGKSGRFWGLKLSSNHPVEVEGTITRIQEASWSVVTIEQADGSIVRIRMA